MPSKIDNVNPETLRYKYSRKVAIFKTLDDAVIPFQFLWTIMDITQGIFLLPFLLGTIVLSGALILFNWLRSSIKYKKRKKEMAAIKEKALAFFADGWVKNEFGNAIPNLKNSKHTAHRAALWAFIMTSVTVSGGILWAGFNIALLALGVNMLSILASVGTLTIGLALVGAALITGLIAGLSAYYAYKKSRYKRLYDSTKLGSSNAKEKRLKNRPLKAYDMLLAFFDSFNHASKAPFALWLILSAMTKLSVSAASIAAFMGTAIPITLVITFMLLIALTIKNIKNRQSLSKEKIQYARAISTRGQRLFKAILRATFFSAILFASFYWPAQRILLGIGLKAMAAVISTPLAIGIAAAICITLAVIYTICHYKKQKADKRYAEKMTQEMEDTDETNPTSESHEITCKIEPAPHLVTEPEPMPHTLVETTLPTKNFPALFGWIPADYERTSRPRLTRHASMDSIDECPVSRESRSHSI